jgi:hypothetical protein
MDDTDERPEFERRRLFKFPEPPVPFSLPYPGERLRWAIEVVGWSVNHFAARIDMAQGSVRQMLENKRFIPEPLAYWIEGLARVHMSAQKPVGWREKPARPTLVA